MPTESVYDVIRGSRLIAIVRVTTPERIAPISEALAAGGIKLIELACTDSGFQDTIRKASAAVGGRVRIGAGTVMSVECARDALEAGAEFVLAPDTNAEVISYCVERNIPVIPGVSTPTEIMQARRLGATMVKLFPAGALGTEYLRQIRGPLGDIELIAAGGINTSNAAGFIECGCVAIGVAGSLVDAELARNGDWEGLTSVAQIYAELVACR